MITHLAPTAASMGPEISPVNAPSLAQYRFWPPISTLDPLVASTAAGRLTKVGQMTISRPVASATSGPNASKKAPVSEAVLYIFQLPAIKGVRMIERD